MMITLILWQAGAIGAPHFYVSRYFEEQKDEYLERLRSVSANADWDGWCQFFLIAIEQQAKRNLQLAQSIDNLYEEIKPRFIELLASKHAVAALDYLFTYPVFNNSRFTSKSGIPAQTAARFTRVLLAAGLLQTVVEAAGRRSALYRFEPLMQIVRA
jgi:Fic family protein